LFYNFAAEPRISCHMNLRENRSQDGLSDRLNAICHGTVPGLGSDRQRDNLTAADLSAAICAAAIAIYSTSDQISLPDSSSSPEDNSGDSPPYPPCFAAWADKLTGDSRLPVLCHVPEHLCRVAVTLYSRLIIAGGVATTVDTNPLR
jgi:hypothetical protein